MTREREAPVMTADLVRFMQESGVNRRFRQDEIPEECIQKILEAGNWGFSVMGIQPWDFVRITSKKTIAEIADILSANAKNIPRLFAMIANLTAVTMRGSSALIAIYNNKKVSARAEKYGGEYLRRVHLAEVQAIGGVMQNMCLEAASLGIGFVWADSPAFFDKEINRVLREDKELIAFLIVGYPAEKSRRSKRALETKNIKTFA